MAMIPIVRDWAKNHPYLLGISFGFLFNWGWLIAMPLKKGLIGFVISGFVAGLPVGIAEFVVWRDVLKKFFPLIGCYLVVALGYCLTGIAIEDYGGDMGGIGIAMMVLVPISLIASPTLLIGGILGWHFRKVRDAI